MKISYAILTHNEGPYIFSLLTNLIEYKEVEDEIIVIDDFSDDTETLQILEDFSRQKHIKVYKHKLDKDFSSQKNFLMSKCSGDYVFNIDADENIKPELIVNLKAILTANPEVDLYAIPRENTVEGITSGHIARWNWRINEKGFINFPDNQLRIIKNNVGIKWQNKVHEVPTGYKRLAVIPDEYALIHTKTILRQEKQNTFYDSI